MPVRSIGANLLRRARAVSFEAWLALVSLFAAVVMLWRPLAYFLGCAGPVAFDDGYTVALAERIIDGHWLPYVDGCSHRGPLLYWSIAVFQTLFGRFRWVGPHYLSLVVILTTLGAIYLAAWAARRPVAAAIAVLMQVWLISVYETTAVFGVTGENVATAPAMLSLALTTLALVRLESVRTRGIVLFAAGVCAALAGLAKQTELAFVAPLALWVAAVSWSEREKLGSNKHTLVAALSGGFALPFVIVLGRYAAGGHLATFWYWFYTYNAEIYMEPTRHVRLRTVFDPLFDHRAFALLALAMAVITTLLSRIAALGPRPLRLVRAWAEGGFELTLSLLTLLTLAGALAPLRFFFHYFVPLFPLASLLVGLGVERALRGARGSRGSFLAASTLGVLAVFFVTLFANDRVMRGLRHYRDGGGWTGAYPEPVCQFIDEHSRPESSLFIWGFDGDLYVTCRRKPASRFIYMTMVAGSLPDRSWHPPTPKYVAKGSREQLLADLKQSSPDVVLDMPYNMKGVSASVIPELDQYLKQNYCELPVIKTKDTREATPWVKRGRPGCP